MPATTGRNDSRSEVEDLRCSRKAQLCRGLHFYKWGNTVVDAAGIEPATSRLRV